MTYCLYAVLEISALVTHGKSPVCGPFFIQMTADFTFFLEFLSQGQE